MLIFSNRIGFSVFLAAAIAAFFSTQPVQAGEASAAKRPNIIFILTDDHRFDALGAMGNPIIHTPHLDALANDGALFTNMFCTTSICAISRANFLTGQWERRHGIDDFNTPLTRAQFAACFAGVLRKGGYRTGIVGKWGLGNPLPVDEYDYFQGYPGQGSYFPPGKSGVAGEHLTDKLGAQALEFLDDCTNEQPFLLQLYHKAPHVNDGNQAWPFPPDPRYNSLYADVTIPKPRTATEAHFKALPPFLQDSESRNRWQQRFADDALYQKSVKDYYRLITGVDDVTGRIIERLKEKKLDRNTVTIFSSDNGFYLGERGLAGKWYMHEESIRLPLFIYDPRQPPSRRGMKLDQMVLSVDIAPTIIELAGLPVPSVMQGTSLIPLLDGKSVPWRDDFFYEHRFTHPRIPQTVGVRSRRWKYTRYISVSPVYEELFDFRTDPHEEHNLAGRPEFAQ